MAEARSRLLRSTTTTATALVAIVIDLWDTDALHWEPEVLKEELGRITDGTVPSINLDKIHGLTTALTTDSFFDDFYVFSYVCNALGGVDEKVAFGTFDPPTPEEMAWTVHEVNLNEPAQNLAEKFHPDVLFFIGLSLRESGLSEPPRVLNFVPIPLEEDVSIFADDPEIYVAYTELLKENKQNVDTYVRERFRQLMVELSSVEFDNGDFKEVYSRIKAKKGK